MDIRNQAEAIADSRQLRIAVVVTLFFVFLLWTLKLAEYLGDFDFSHYGIYPRRISGLAGVLFAPFIHASLLHLFTNTAPIVVMGSLLLYAYPRAAWIMLPTVYFGSGAAVWLFAREAYHIGASGLAFGMLFFVFTIGILRWDRRSIAISLVVIFLYGGMIWGIFPSLPEISFESHLSGAVIGVFTALLLRNRDPAPPSKLYSWEREDADDDDFDWPDELR